MNENDEQIARAAKEVNDNGVRRFGQDRWSQSVAAFSKSLPRHISGAEAVKAACTQPDPAGAVFAAGRDALINQATNGDDEAEQIYSAMRAEERQAYRISKGKVR